MIRVTIGDQGTGKSALLMKEVKEYENPAVLVFEDHFIYSRNGEKMEAICVYDGYAQWITDLIESSSRHVFVDEYQAISKSCLRVLLSLYEIKYLDTLHLYGTPNIEGGFPNRTHNYMMNYIECDHNEDILIEYRKL